MSVPSNPDERTPLLSDTCRQEPITDTRVLSSSKFPQSIDEAHRHIREIQQTHETYIGESWIPNMVKRLSEEQYTNNARFLFELLQNADDNSYDGNEPLMKIHLRDQYLIIQSNEVGFTRSNVDSICRLADSSKSHKEADSDQRGLIGEKGIGFKAVFLVANKVWIKSGHYSFRFDRDVPLGRVYPNWVDHFPESLADIDESRMTSIVLELGGTRQPSGSSLTRNSSQRTDIVNLLRGFGPAELLFLSQVKRIEIDIDHKTNMFKWVNNHKTILRAAPIPKSSQTLHLLYTFKNDVKQPYITYRHPVSKLPREEKRPNCHDSEIVFAFRLPILGSQSSSTNKVYAFLPIKDYGFKFLIHSDFILSTNREDIIDNPWNNRLLDETAVAFTEAVSKAKNQSPELWYTWPLLLPFNATDSICRSAQACMIATFRTKKLLEDVKGHCHKPEKLVFVPKEFTDNMGNPLIPHQYGISNRISDKYPIQVETPLEDLGVQFQSESGFLNDLENFTKYHFGQFRVMAESWHLQLCKVLLTLIGRYKSIIKRLPLILLADRKTLVSSNTQLYFRDFALGLSLPAHIGAYEVDSSCRHSERGHLFSELGVVEGTSEQLCNYVLDDNKRKTSRPVEDMVSGILFLFQAGWNSTSTVSGALRFKTNAGNDIQISDMYIQSDIPYTASTMPKEVKNTLHFIHPAYLETFGNHSGGQSWLFDTFQLRPELRIVSHHSPDEFHENFQRLLNKHPHVALEMLRTHWISYRSHFEQTVSPTPAIMNRLGNAERLKDTLSKTLVPCSGGAKVMLRETYLPTADMLAMCGDGALPPPPSRSPRSCCGLESLSSHIGWKWGVLSGISPPSERLLNIENPNDDSWSFLRIFGVTIKPGAQPFIDYLRQIRGKHVSHDIVDRLYASLESIMYGPDRVAITNFFNEPQSIYIPDSHKASTGTWRDLDSCVWKGPNCLKQTPRLSSLYKHRSRLFNSLAPTTTLRTLEKEAMHLKVCDIDHIESVIRAISEYLVQATRDGLSPVPTFDNCQMFPIMSGDSGHINLRSVSELTSNPWFIADSPDLYRAFSKVVNLCVILGPVFEFNKDITHHLGLHSRFLSKYVTRATILPKKDECQQLETYSERLRCNAKFISRLAPPSQERIAGRTKEQLLAGIQVLRCQKIEFQWTLKSNQQVFKSLVEKGRAALNVDNAAGVLEAYVTDEEDFLNGGYTPFELSDELIKFFRIKDERDTILLAKFMDERNPKFLNEYLKCRDQQRRGLRQPSFRFGSSHDENHMSVDSPAAPPPGVIADGDEARQVSISAEVVEATPDQPQSLGSKSDDRQTFRGHHDGQALIRAIDHDDKMRDRDEDIPHSTQSIDPVPTPNTMNVDDGTMKPGPVAETKIEPPVQRTSGGKVAKWLVSSYVAQTTHDSPRPINLRSEDDSSKSSRSEGNRFTTDASTPKSKTVSSPSQQSDWKVIPSGDFQATMEEVQQRRNEPRKDFVNMRCGIMIRPSPYTVFLGDDTQDTAYYGELYVSRFLASVVGPDSYDPDENWTSPMRARHGRGRFHPTSDKPHSNFTIEQHAGGKLIELMMRDAKMRDFQLSDPCTFHIQVCATNNGLDAQFDVPRDQYRMAKDMCLQQGKTNKQVYILARVYNIRSKSSLALYVDPWRLQQEGGISLESPYDYVGKVLPTAPTFLSDNCWVASESSVTKDKSIYFGLEISPAQFRLLKLEPDENGKPLRAKLVRKNIDNDVCFWAISYVWGPEPTKRGPVLKVNGQVEVPITESLSSCLTTLSRQKTNAYIWVDAICINQGDDVEKAMQVRRMGSIYSKAEQVMVWLGHETDDDRDAVTSLQRLRQILRQSEGISFQLNSEEIVISERINFLLRREWFSRTWIVQELVLGSKVIVMHGNHRVEWESLMEGILECDKMIQRKLGWTEDQNRSYFTDASTAFALHDIREGYKGSSEGPRKSLKYSLLELIERLFPTRSSFLRDKLFALLNLAHDTSTDDDFSPDYKVKDTTILMRFARGFVKSDQALDLLCRAGAGKGVEFGSWIPDLMNSRRESRYAPTISTWEAAGYGKETRFSAGAPLPCDAKVKVAASVAVMGRRLPPVLSLKGIMFDKVKSCRDLDISFSGAMVHLTKTFVVFQSLVRDLFLRQYEHMGESWKDRLLVKCLIGDAVGPSDHANQELSFNNVPVGAREKWAPGFEKHIIDMHPGHDAQQYVKGTPESLRTINEFWATASVFLGKIPGAKVCVTEKGYVGIFPGSTQVGDKIFIPHSANTPFAVRKSALASKYHHLIGESYVHGIMYYEVSPVRDMGEVVVSLI